MPTEKSQYDDVKYTKKIGRFQHIKGQSLKDMQKARVQWRGSPKKSLGLYGQNNYR